MSGPVKPATARPRTDATVPLTAPPSRSELEAIERQRTDWTALLGAVVADVDGLGRLVRHDRPGSALNFLGRIRWPAEDFSARLDATAELMRSSGMWPSLIVSEGLSEPPDIGSRLRSAGWIPLGSERTMFSRHPASVPHLDPGLRVEAVTPATALECVRLETASFGLLPDAIGESAERLADSVMAGTTRAFLLRFVREPVASARLVPGAEVAGLHAINVTARHRRRGYGRMLTAVASRAGLATGHRLVWLSVDEENAPAVNLYRSLGFEPAFAWTRWAAPA